MNKRIPPVLYAIGYLALGTIVPCVIVVAVWFWHKWLFGDRWEQISNWMGVLGIILGWAINWLQAKCFARSKDVLPRKLILAWKWAWGITIATIFIALTLWYFH